MAEERIVFRPGPAGPGWDEFVFSQPGGHLTQTTGWASLKEASGWSVGHIGAWSGSSPVGGAHVFWKRLAPGVAGGYVTKGPLIASGADRLLPELEAELGRLCRSENIRVLAVQPPAGGDATGRALDDAGWQSGLFEILLPATVRLSLQASDEALLGAMRPSTRANVRRGGRRTEVRVEGRTSLQTFAKLLADTGERQGFVPESAAYLGLMWDHLEESAEPRLVMGYADGEPVSGLLLVGAGRTVYYKRGGWSGAAGSSRPNEAVHWEAIRWGRGAGYDCYELEGIDIRAARAALAGEPIPPDLEQSVSRFKVGLGGVVVIDPLTRVMFRPVLAGRTLAIARKSGAFTRFLERTIKQVRLG